MTAIRPALLLLGLAIAGCDLEPPRGTQIGALREPEPPPAPPSDIDEIDLEAAIADAFAVAAASTLAQAWAFHEDLLDVDGVPHCPEVWVGPLPEDVTDMDMDDDNPGMSWLADCATPAGVDWSGWAHWSALLPTGTVADRTFDGDLAIAGADGVWLEIDGEMSDAIDNEGVYAYSSNFAGEILGSLVTEGGIRGELDASWSADGSFSLFGAITDLDGFGPPDTRHPETAPEVGFDGWTPGMPRFTSVRYDLSLEPTTCGLEPAGYIGIRGNEGFWLDVYFLPIYDPEENSAQSNAFPFELIENQSCDGIGTLFARNLLLEDPSGSATEADTTLAREVAPDFAAIVASMPVPLPGDDLITLREVTETP